MTVVSGRRAGRPSLMAERRAQLVSAFIELVARDGLEHVTLDEVAVAAGMKRSALNHFIGNREDLIVATVDELVARYNSATSEVAGTEPDIQQLLALMFSDGWIRGNAVEDAAFDGVLFEAIRNARTRAILKSAYDNFIAQIEAALQRSYPDAPSAAVRETGYAIACVIEQNITFQQLGYPRARVRGAKQAALALAARLGSQGGL